MKKSAKSGKQQQAGKPAPKRGPIKEGIKRGRPEPVPRGGFPPGPAAQPCANCVITQINGQAFPAGKNNAITALPENTPAFVMRATPNPANCPCRWSNEVFIEYVAVLTGAAQILKRKNFQFPQILELIKVNTRDPQNPYVTINGCTLTIKISQLNDDLRKGINTQNAFFQGVVTRLKLGVKCNSRFRTIYIDVTDKP